MVLSCRLSTKKILKKEDGVLVQFFEINNALKKVDKLSNLFDC